MSRGTLSYILRNVPLASEQEEHLREKAAANRKLFVKKVAGVDPEVRKVWSSKGGKMVWKLHHRVIAKNLNAAGRERGHLTYRKDELPIKAILENLYSRIFRKERIGNRIIDFACVD
ncbi:MAG: hypothetical protein ACRD2L_02835, partial [Terriglobia bacterium]